MFQKFLRVIMGVFHRVTNKHHHEIPFIEHRNSLAEVGYSK